MEFMRNLERGCNSYVIKEVVTAAPNPSFKRGTAGHRTKYSLPIPKVKAELLSHNEVTRERRSRGPSIMASTPRICSLYIQHS